MYCWILYSLRYCKISNKFGAGTTFAGHQADYIWAQKNGESWNSSSRMVLSDTLPNTMYKLRTIVYTVQPLVWNAYIQIFLRNFHSKYECMTIYSILGVTSHIEVKFRTRRKMSRKLTFHPILPAKLDFRATLCSTNKIKVCVQGFLKSIWKLINVTYKYFMF